MKHEIKYILHPGPIISKIHGEKEHISARQLARLYRVNYAECKIAGTKNIDEKDKIHLWPKASGKYVIQNNLEVNNES